MPGGSSGSLLLNHLGRACPEDLRLLETARAMEQWGMGVVAARDKQRWVERTEAERAPGQVEGVGLVMQSCCMGRRG